MKAANRNERFAEWKRGELLAELVRMTKAAGRPVHAREIPRSLWAALRSTFGSMEKARKAAGLPSAHGPRRWSEELVIKEMRRAARGGVVLSDRGLADAGHRDLLGAIRMYFGSIVRARAIAGLPAPPQPRGPRERWDETRVVQEIMERYESELPLAKTKSPQRLVRAGQRYFGSWRAAVEAAGLSYDEVRLVREAYTADEVLAELQRLSTERPSMVWSELTDEKFYPAVARLFGSLDEALQRAGLDGWPLRLREPMLTRSAVLEELRARRRAGKPAHFLAVQEQDRHLWYSAITHFGTWDAAIAAAGLAQVRPRRRWSRDALIAALRDRARRRLSNRPGDVGREDPGLYITARNHFGSFQQALRAAGLDPGRAPRKAAHSQRKE